MSSADIGARSEVRPEQGTGEHGHFGRGAAVAAETPGSGGTRNVLHVLGNREFALFWSGQTISQTGTWMQQFAQGWVVTTLAGSALALASVNFAASIPMLILMPFGGVAGGPDGEAPDPVGYTVGDGRARRAAGCADPGTSSPPLARLADSPPAWPRHRLRPAGVPIVLSAARRNGRPAPGDRAEPGNLPRLPHNRPGHRLLVCRPVGNGGRLLCQRRQLPRRDRQSAADKAQGCDRCQAQ